MLISFDELPEQIRDFYHNTDRRLSRIYKRTGIYGPIYGVARKVPKLDIWEQEKGCPPKWKLKQLAGTILRRR